MKTLILILSVIFVGFFACKKDETETLQKPRYLVKYQVDCSTSGFDIIYTNAICKVEKKFISDIHWDTTFMNISNDTLVLAAIPRNIHSKITGKIYYNGFAVDSMTIDNNNPNGCNTCSVYIDFWYIIK